MDKCWCLTSDVTYVVCLFYVFFLYVSMDIGRLEV